MGEKIKMLAYRPNKLLKYIMIYLIFTEIFYFLGPIRWGTGNQLGLVFFLLGVNLSFFLGYKYEARKLRNRVDIYYEDNKEHIFRVANLALIMNLLISILYLMHKASTTSLANILAKVIISLTNPSSAYMEKFSAQGLGFSGIATVLLTAGSFFLWSVIPLGIYYFKELKLFTKILVVINIIVEISRWLVTGTNKGLIDLFLIVVALLALKYVPKEKTKNNSFKKIVLVIISIVLAFVLLGFFLNNIGGRVSDNSVYFFNNLAGASIKSEGFWGAVPDGIVKAAMYMQSYLCQGYYGLELSLSEKWMPMFGIGHSVFLTENIDSLLGTDFAAMTYSRRINYTGWSAKANWHSAYTWFANDLTFIGTIIFFFLIGIMVAKIYLYAQKSKNGAFISLFCLVIIFIFYLPMNNQIFMASTQCMGLYGLLLYWINKKYIKIKLRIKK